MDGVAQDRDGRVQVDRRDEVVVPVQRFQTIGNRLGRPLPETRWGLEHQPAEFFRRQNREPGRQPAAEGMAQDSDALGIETVLQPVARAGAPAKQFGDEKRDVNGPLARRPPPPGVVVGQGPGRQGRQRGVAGMVR